MVELEVDIDKCKADGCTVEEVQEMFEEAKVLNYLQMEGFIEVESWTDDGEPRFRSTGD